MPARRSIESLAARKERLIRENSLHRDRLQSQSAPIRQLLGWVDLGLSIARRSGEFLSFASPLAAGLFSRAHGDPPGKISLLVSLLQSLPGLGSLAGFFQRRH